MSSEISISRPTADDGFRPWHFFVLVSILLATVAVILARQTSPGHLILLSLTIAAAGAAAAALHRTLLPLLGVVRTQPDEPIGERTRAALQREKMLVLRSIKELEFDRAMGKLSQHDFDEMAGRLRSRALSLMTQLDAGAAGYTQVIEKELATRLEAVPARMSVQPTGEVSALCSSCRAANDADAVFCKKCGTRLRT